LRIAVCDDDPILRDELKNAVYTYSNQHRIESLIDEFKCGEDLVDSKYTYEIIFLDYQMEKLNGMDTARILRKNNQTGSIIFLTAYPDFVYESFEVDTYRFLKKPLDTEKLYDVLDDYFSELRKNKTILMKVNYGTVSIQTNDILFLEAQNKKCNIYLKNEVLTVNTMMAAVFKELPPNEFFKTHKGFIVNLNNIKSYNSNHVYFNNSYFAMISRNYYTAFKKAFMIYSKIKGI